MEWADTTDDVRRQRWDDYWLGRGDWSGYGLGDRIVGIEIMPAPYIVFRLRLAIMLRTLGGCTSPLIQPNLHLGNALVLAFDTDDVHAATVVVGNPPFSIQSGSLSANLAPAN